MGEAFITRRGGGGGKKKVFDIHFTSGLSGVDISELKTNVASLPINKLYWFEGFIETNTHYFYFSAYVYRPTQDSNCHEFLRTTQLSTNSYYLAMCGIITKDTGLSAGFFGSNGYCVLIQTAPSSSNPQFYMSLQYSPGSAYVNSSNVVTSNFAVYELDS